MGTRSIGFLLILVLVLAIGSMIDLAQAQTGNRGDGHTEHHDMYKDWEQPDVGGSCCNAQSADDPAGDCRPTTAYIGDDGRWHARVGPGPEDFAIRPVGSCVDAPVDARDLLTAPAMIGCGHVSGLEVRLCHMPRASMEIRRPGADQKRER